jgi:hypothetical protein
MTTLAIGSSITVAVRDGGTVAIATNGGFGTVSATPVGGAAVSASFGPEPARRVFGPFSEGASVTVTNNSCNAFDYDLQGAMGDYLGPFAWASLPDATLYAGYRARVTDGGPTGGIYVVSDGVRWKPVNGTANLKTLGAAVSGIANTEQIVLQALLPINFWQTNDNLRLWLATTKSGATDSMNLNVRVGTAGTTADTAVMTVSAMGATNLSSGLQFDFRLVSATSLQRVGQIASSTGSYVGASNTAAPAAVTISDASANALYVSVGIASSGATNTVAAQSGQIQIITP